VASALEFVPTVNRRRPAFFSKKIYAKLMEQEAKPPTQRKLF